RFYDVGRHRDPADRLDVAARDRLLVGDDRQRLHHRTRIARRLFRRQPFQERLDRGLRLEAPAAGNLDQLDIATVPLFANPVEQIAHDVGFEWRVEQLRQLTYRQRFAGDQQHGLENVFDLFQ